jgi:ADP-ribosyl-[dinitrogen reductase] hydrolase
MLASKINREPIGWAMSYQKTEDRAVGALLGLAIGDAVGTTLEFSARDTSPPMTDMVGGGPFGLRAGEWTDDTAMALALAESLGQRNDFDPVDLMNRFVNWMDYGLYSCTGICFDIGITTRLALNRYKEGGNPFAGSTDPHTAGNGSLMRLSPVAIRYWNDPATLARTSALQSRTTHGAVEAVDACIGFSHLLSEAISGVAKADVLAPRTMELSPAIEGIFAGSWRDAPRERIRSTGYVVHSLEAAIWCVAHAEDFGEAVLLAANLGDDADTVAAITGQLAGALWGKSGIPIDWLTRLAWRDELEQAATRLFQLSIHNISGATPRPDTL